MDALLTTKDVAAVLGRSERFVSDRAREGKIEAARIGKAFRFRPEWVERYVESSKQEAKGGATSPVESNPWNRAKKGA